MIGGENRDALGLESNEAAYAFLQDSSLGVEEKAIRQIKTCYDPELPVNVYDLGLIYHIDVLESSMHIAMTLTSPTCGMGPFIVEEVKRKLHMIPGVDQVKIELVFDPPWDKTRLSQTAKLALNIF
nr:iron-sulfur cluster assembly protein [Candidatus Synchoanobacter obligatus]